jgi:hypothetical protein
MEIPCMESSFRSTFEVKSPVMENEEVTNELSWQRNVPVGYMVLQKEGYG